MKYSSAIYARAFTEILDRITPAQRDMVTSRFAAILVKNGDIHRARYIIKAIQKILVARRGGRMVQFEFARSPESKAVGALSKRFSEKDHIESIVTPGLVAGVRITIDEEFQLDYSFARKLHKLFA